MSVVIKSRQVKFRNTGSEDYHGINAISEEKTTDMIQQIEQKGQEVKNSIPSDYTELSQEVSELNDNVSDLKSALSASYSGVIQKYISEETDSFTEASYRVTTGHITKSVPITLTSVDTGEHGYSFRIFDAEGEYISNSWNTSYTINANTEFYLLIRKTDATHLTAAEARQAVIITYKSTIRLEIDSIEEDIDGLETGAETMAGDISDIKNALAINVDQPFLEEFDEGTVKQDIGDVTTMTYNSSARRYTTSHMLFHYDIFLKTKTVQGDSYAFRIFDAEGGYISGAWNTEYTIPANTEFYLLIKNTSNSSWEEAEAKASVTVSYTPHIAQRIAQLGNRASALEGSVFELSAVKALNLIGSHPGDGKAVHYFINYSFTKGTKYTVNFTAKGATNLVTSRAIVVATTNAKSIGGAVDFFTNKESSPIGIVANLKAGDSYSGTLTATGDAEWLIVDLYSNAVSAFDVDITVGMLPNIKATAEAMTDWSMVMLNKDIEPTVLQLAASIPEASDYASSTYKRLTFAHFSDVHNSETHWNRICDYIDAFEHIKFAVHTGDYTGAYLGDIVDLYGLKKPKNKAILNVVGNHDTYIGYHPAVKGTAAQVKAALYASVDPVSDGWDCIFGSADNAMYWYKDDSDSKVRLIAIDQYFWDATEAAWFDTVLADARTNDYAVILLMHTPMTKKVTTIGSGFWTLGGWDTGISESEGTEPIDTIRASVNSFITAGGLFLCYLCGHIHSDQIGTLDNDGLLQIRIETASGAGVWCESNRKIRTKCYDCLNLIQVDRAYGFLKVVRVGVNVDEHMQQKNALCWDYVNRRMISAW